MSTVSFESALQHLLNGDHIETDLPESRLVERALSRGEGVLTKSGAFAATTGLYTGRSPKDKFIVDEPSVHDSIDWGVVNAAVDKDVFSKLYRKVLHYLGQQDALFVTNGYAGKDTDYRLSLRVVNEFAWHNLFARQLFIRPEENERPAEEENGFTIVSAPGFKADPEVDGTRSEAFVHISFEERIVLIGGTEYAGEMKKSIFSIMNYLLPAQNVLPMHCSANTGKEGDVALFFGLSGTGKTTLSADRTRFLIGDDEHGWSDNGVFNIEGGCYAKTINLSKEKEPDIYDAIRFGAVLENVVVDEESRKPDYDDGYYTENTRAAYPLEHIQNVLPQGVAGHPNTIIFLTADAFGVLPPISRLTKEQAMYHFLSGYTSKLAGTERGVTEPEATFSSCFGAPFLPRHASVYAEMLGEKIDQHEVNVFLVNTGWNAGGYGSSDRIPLNYTRAMVQAALEGELTNVQTNQDPIFGLHIPKRVPGVPDEVLQPKSTWDDPKAYDEKASQLAKKFKENFERFSHVSDEIRNAGPTFK
ncbi:MULTISPECIES: phosphoenolpyruvate carboxykinase (ATP) [Geomicrobium]|uniref:Phosphoenolpyruvate carboxykinase (ATP) n=1 Tax=Geomicrobium sediminis TaxID=1347788 RepID=A0ABS2P944_9BACL|nr:MULTISPECIES: phosphoenolpyruvate carboxykinase (ATP) [Geomicrobium]EZH68077.1 phosphoenolpyruvate carboxykinase [Bacillaceae bacterium JMAK1]MBM7631929.1 phosphoenolpyruvate carboxykinase (ATP) [Geomicrobium sediminis]GAK10200.1 phosphoenolpyruvate carboxykinase [Geomicrobium sp. JCM 19038]